MKIPLAMRDLHGIPAVTAELASILGTALRYDVADMVGSQVSILAKIPEAVLATMQRAK
jgi:hypothetical protein